MSALCVSTRVTHRHEIKPPDYRIPPVSSEPLFLIEYIPIQKKQDYMLGKQLRKSKNQIFYSESLLFGCSAVRLLLYTRRLTCCSFRSYAKAFS